MYGRIILLIFLYACVDSLALGHNGMITRCLNRRKEHIYISCPDDYLIYQPEIFLGVNNKSECDYKPGDCIGLSYNLLKQKNKCHWRNSCHFGWRKGDVILRTDEQKCIGALPNYVSYIHPMCIPKGVVHNICDSHKKMLTSKFGIIRSHREYPWAYGTTSLTCSSTIDILSGFHLTLKLDDVQTRNGDYLLIRNKINSTLVTIFNGTNCSGDIFSIHSGSVEIEFISQPGATIGRGFVIQFKQNQLFEYIKPYVKTIPSTNGEVNGIIEECMNQKTDTIFMTCPADHVIYKPKMSVGASNYGVCYGKPGDCRGQVHTILTRQNNCYWKSDCSVSWNGNIPITMFAYATCLSLMPSYVTISKFQCIRKDHVFDICDKTIWEIRELKGLIKSHKTYPWNYQAVSKTCRIRLNVNARFGLRLYTEDFDLDIDARKERVNIWHVTPSGRRIKKNKLRGQQQTELVVQSGCIDIEFKTSNITKAGRGFVLAFENYLEISENESNVISVSNQDNCRGKATFFRRKSKKKKGKSRHLTQNNFNRTMHRRRKKGRKRNHRKNTIQT